VAEKSTILPQKQFFQSNATARFASCHNGTLNGNLRQEVFLVASNWTRSFRCVNWLFLGIVPVSHLVFTDGNKCCWRETEP